MTASTESLSKVKNQSRSATEALPLPSEGATPMAKSHSIFDEKFNSSFTTSKSSVAASGNMTGETLLFGKLFSHNFIIFVFFIQSINQKAGLAVIL